MPEPSRDSVHRISRRQLLQGGAAAAAASSLGLQACGGSGSSQASIRRPNFLILLCDEMRYPPVYESTQLATWRAQTLRTQNALRATGVEFHRHYAAATACAPSRGSIYTGHYPSLHGVTQTTGAAKEAYDPDVYWLDPDTVPTMGDYFRAAGYATFWRGKWHASAADLLVAGTHQQVPSYDALGLPVPEVEAAYLAADRLDGLGFRGWIGPEPHGRDPLNSGSSAAGARGRDPGFADQTIELLDALDRSGTTTPWLAVASFVNPHDITLYGLAARSTGLFDFSVDPDVPHDLFDTSMFQMTLDDDLSLKPSCQASYQQTYAIWMQPILDRQQYSRVYYQLHKDVDDEMWRVYQKLMATRFFENTIVIFTSDHGDLLGSHADMHQKWYQVYEEALHVPLIISNPGLFPEPLSVDSLTSHVDLLPTMLGMAGLQAAPLRQKLALDHTDAKPLVGRNLTQLVLGDTPPQDVDDPLFFMTNDNPSRGLDQDNWTGIAYNAVVQPNSIWCVIARLADGKVWKYARYFDNPQFWTTPGDPCDTNSGANDVASKEVGLPPSTPGTYVIPYDYTLKEAPFPDEFEMYDVTDDPMELDNKYGNATYAAEQTALESLLEQQCQQKRLLPNNGPVDGQPATCATGGPC